MRVNNMKNTNNNNENEMFKQLQELSILYNRIHITMDELDQYVEGLPSVAFRVENHIRECHSCNDMIEMLAEYRYGMTMNELKASRRTELKEPVEGWEEALHRVSKALSKLKEILIPTPILVAMPARAATESDWQYFTDEKTGIKYSKRELNDGSMEIKVLIDADEKPKLKIQWDDFCEDIPLDGDEMNGFVGEISIGKEKRANEKPGSTISFILIEDK